MMMSEDAPKPTEKEMQKLMSRPLIKAAALLIKNTLDKRFGLTWHAAVGEGFGFDITCQNRYLIYVFYGSVGVLCYKC
ncbi:hypothetical protein TeGR_g8037 [Tetraparma gracilis]|uniref:Dynein light chain n=1 Tax=Tetraparma gracilis TaxID=2962635 RepID=A0ABQ6MJR3_9STRA|nr:hypothetical protein TeGR_g8037 [Tetraparma gracilis]